jgi:hypothetical protein
MIALAHLLNEVGSPYLIFLLFFLLYEKIFYNISNIHIFD